MRCMKRSIYQLLRAVETGINSWNGVDSLEFVITQFQRGKPSFSPAFQSAALSEMHEKKKGVQNRVYVQTCLS